MNIDKLIIMKHKDLTGQKFGKLTVLKPSNITSYIDISGRKVNIHYYQCKCDCGYIEVIPSSYIRSPRSNSKNCYCKNNFINYIGNKFGYLTPVELIEYNYEKNVYKYKCICDCGKIVIKRASTIRQNKNISCGCANKLPNFIHGHNINCKKSPELTALCNLKNRCLNSKNKSFHRYGGRGITVCDEWLSDKGFENFLTDMGRKPTPKHSIDRIDVNGNYCKENCRWATSIEQGANTTRSLNLKINGIKYSIRTISELTNVSIYKLTTRLKNNTLNNYKYFINDAEIKIEQ